MSLTVLEASAIEDKETAAIQESAVEDQVTDVSDQVSALEPEAKEQKGASVSAFPRWEAR